MNLSASAGRVTRTGNSLHHTHQSISQSEVAPSTFLEMSSSLAPECTPLKHEYDTCFNAWFEGYLEPAVTAPTPEQRTKWAQEQAAEYERRCGKVWAQYKECVQVCFYTVWS